MKRMVRFFTPGKVFFIIIILGAVLRFWDYSAFSFSNDELSALYRADQPGFVEMIRGGVMPDFHPAGVQTFIYYWVKAFGTSEAAVRFPFVIMGILSLFPAYFIGKRWFGKTTALFFIASLAFLQYPLLYSQIARPYAPGMLLSLSMILFWTRIVFPNHQDLSHQKMNYAGFVLTTAACAYDQYFCGLMAIIVSLTGFFFLRKEQLKPYIICLIISSLLFVPHIPISLQHFSIGGIGEWLGKPGSLWIVQHLFYLFNESWFFLVSALGMLALSLIIFRKVLSFNKFHIILLFWVSLPLIIGYYYSLFINPVIQHSVLIFSSPLLFLFIFSWWNDKWTQLSVIALLVYLIIGALDTVAIKRYYRQQHFGEFKKVAAKIDEWNTHFGIDKITQVISVNNPYYINFYFKKLGKEYSFAQYDNRWGKDLGELLDIINGSDSPFFISAWTKPSPDEIDAMIREKYPCILERVRYGELSAVTFYTKKTGLGLPCLNDTAEYKVFNSFETGNLWGTELKHRSKEYTLSGNYSVCLDGIEYGPTYQGLIQDIIHGQVKTLRICITAMMDEEGCDAQIVADLFTSSGNSYAWKSMNFNNFLTVGKRGKVFFTYNIPDQVKATDLLKIYIWNHGLKKIYIDNFSIEFFR